MELSTTSEAEKSITDKIGMILTKDITDELKINEIESTINPFLALQSFKKVFSKGGLNKGKCIQMNIYIMGPFIGSNYNV